MKPKHILRVICIAYFLTIAHTTTYALWGIPEIAIIATAVISGGSCAGYEHSRINKIGLEISEIKTGQEKTNVAVKTISGITGTYGNIMSAVSSNLQIVSAQMRDRRPTTSSISHELDSIVDECLPSQEQGRTPAQLPGSVPPS